MKKSTLFLTVLFMTSINFAQDFEGNASGTFGILNAKARIQYEMPLKDRASFGINVNYYFVNWTGPVLEPFIRIYGRNGNAEGFFSQLKLCYGNLSIIDYNSDYYEKSRFSTYGFGLSVGYKFLIYDNFTIEPLLGYRLLTPPILSYKTGYSQDDVDALDIGETIGWYLTTAFPLDLQVKFGYQF